MENGFEETRGRGIGKVILKKYSNTSSHPPPSFRLVSVRHPVQQRL